ncbi:transglycosylase domain-containing protein [Rubrobacter calidifluminis]|uniref:transglycosylase domain-containing protein n=1 Tax=Rubrobacter calidifluminis TaxID=1392640 RepID=UPI0023612714|nr:transglycosylase domain-containing protein [Rubrobacter calidifluminis]
MLGGGFTRRRRIRRERGRFWRRVRTLVVLFCCACVLGVAAFTAAFAYAYFRVARSLPRLSDYRSIQLAQTSTVYDEDGHVVDELYGAQNRYVVPLDRMSPHLRRAVVAIEDHRFYEHGGLDFEAIARAAEADIATLSIREGGSTITQQLIKNTYISPKERYVPSFQRKIDEAALAWQYDKKHSKREILEEYLNTVYFGENAYGAEAAARTYFDEHASQLTLPQAALLAGIINLPTTYDPYIHPKEALKRRNVVLDKMLQYGYITRKQHDRAVKQPIELRRGTVRPRKDDQYFLDAVRRELTRRFGQKMIYGGGLKIYTTLDPYLQKAATGAVNETLNPSAGDPSAALVSVDPSTGAVRALVGGSDYSKVKFNLATQAHRQPGSSFKVFDLAAAIHQGISPKTMYVSKNLDIPMPRGSKQPYYHVENYGGIQRGPITIEKAAEQSDNTVFVQLALDVGMKNVVAMAHAMGITSKLDTYPSAAIGGLTYGVTPLEMASAYSTLANHGVHMKPYLIQKVTREENGRQVVLYRHKPKSNRALSRDEAAAVTQVLEKVVQKGTPSYYHNLDAEIGRPSAGKTGTTENFVDAWYVGYIPQLSTSVWVGYPKERKPMVNIDGLSVVNGENFPLDIWSRYMQLAVQRFPQVVPFDTPSPSFHLEIKRNGRAYVPPPPKPKKKQNTPGGESAPSTTSRVGGTTIAAPGTAGSPSSGSPQTVVASPQQNVPGAVRRQAPASGRAGSFFGKNGIFGGSLFGR